MLCCIAEQASRRMGYGKREHRHISFRDNGILA